MFPIDQIKSWLSNIVLKKSLRSVVGVAIAFVLSTQIAPYLQQLGIEINKEQMEIGLTALLAGGLEALRTWLKAKYKLTML